MKRLFIMFISVMGWSTVCSHAQTDSLYHIQVSMSASPSINFFKDERYPGGPNTPRIGYGMNVRALWRPGHLLALGVMSGYLFIAEDEFHVPSVHGDDTDNRAAARLNAIPLQVVVAMQKHGVEIGLGMGPYLLLSTIEYGRAARSRRLELGLTLYGAYTFSVGNSIRIGPELRVLYLDYRRILSVMPSLTARYDIWSY